MKPAPKLTFLVAGGVASALLVFAFASASEMEIEHRGVVMAGAHALAVSIEEVGVRERERLMRFDEDEDGTVTLEEYGKRGTFAGLSTDSLPDFEAMEVEDIVEWSSSVAESVADGDGRRVVIRKTGKGPADVRVGPRRRAHDFMAFGRGADDWFETADANGDGVLDKAEVDGAPERMRMERTKRRFDRLDLNNDDVLDEADVDLQLKKLEAIDTDGDGEVSHAEVSELMRLLRPRGVGIRHLAEPLRRIKVEREYERG